MSMDYDKENPPWLRLPKEPVRWYARFTQYRNMGVTRSIRKIYLDHMEKSGRDVQKYAKSGVNPAWLQAAQKYNWKERAEAWDQSILDEDELVAREEARRKRIFREERRDDSLDKLMDMIEALDPAIHEMRAGDLFRSLALLHDDQRKDYEERIERAEKAKKGGPNLDAPVTLADLVKLAMSMREPAPIAEQPPTPALPSKNKDEIIDANFVTIQEEKPEYKT